MTVIGYIRVSSDKQDLHKLKMPLRCIRSLIDPRLESPLAYPSYRYFVRQDQAGTEMRREASFKSV